MKEHHPAKGWKMGEYPGTLPKPETVEDALAEMKTFNHHLSVKILREALGRVHGTLEAILQLHVPVLEDGEPVGCECCDWDYVGNESWPCATYRETEKLCLFLGINTQPEELTLDEQSV